MRRIFAHSFVGKVVITKNHELEFVVSEERKLADIGFNKFVTELKTANGSKHYAVCSTTEKSTMYDAYETFDKLLEDNLDINMVYAEVLSNAINNVELKKLIETNIEEFEVIENYEEKFLVGDTIVEIETNDFLGYGVLRNGFIYVVTDENTHRIPNKYESEIKRITTIDKENTLVCITSYSDIVSNINNKKLTVEIRFINGMSLKLNNREAKYCYVGNNNIEGLLYDYLYFAKEKAYRIRIDYTSNFNFISVYEIPSDTALDGYKLLYRNRVIKEDKNNIKTYVTSCNKFFEFYN